MLNYFFVAATWLIGTLGVTGAVGVIVAAVILGPTAVIEIARPLLTRFLSCLWCVVAVVFLMATVGAYWVGHHEAVSDCRAGELAAKLRNQQIDLDNARKAEADEASRANTIEEKANARQKDDADYIAHLEARPACSLDDSDLGGVPNHKSGAGRKKSPVGAK